MKSNSMITFIIGKTSSGKWPLLQTERYKKVALFTFQHVNRLVPDIFNDFFQKDNHGKGIREDAI